MPECLSATSALFSASVLREVTSRSYSQRFARLASQTGISLRPEQTVAEFLDEAFRVLARSAFRDEYVYKTVLLRRRLLGRHTLNTATALSEFRVDECKADLVVLNGTSTVYEIKSERDNLGKLLSQVSAYSRVFDKIFVAAASKHLARLETLLPKTVGLLTISRGLNVSTIRDAASRRDEVNPLSICNCLRQEEALYVLKRLGRFVPDVPNTQLRSATRRVFAGLPGRIVHDEMVSVLRETRRLDARKDYVKHLPSSLLVPALFMDLPTSYENNLFKAMREGVTNPTH